MNKKVYARLIDTTNSNQFKDAVIAALDSADDKILRFLDIVFGCEIKVDELPAQKLDWSDRVNTLTSIDYINNRVNYIYDDKDTKYFENEELAKTYSETGKYSGVWSYNPSEKTPYKAEYKHKSTSWCTISDWLERNNPTTIENE